MGKRAVIKTESNNKVANLSLDFIIPLELITEWSNCSLIANYLANYQGINFEKKESIINNLSIITNELLENASKFSLDKNKIVSISIQQFETEVMIKITNISNKKHSQNLKRILNKLSQKTAEKLLLKQIIKNQKTPQSSEIGIISLVKHYDCQINVSITPKPNTYLVEVQIELLVEINKLKEN